MSILDWNSDVLYDTLSNSCVWTNSWTLDFFGPDFELNSNMAACIAKVLVHSMMIS